MTEQEWLACGEPERMLDFLLGRDYGSWGKFVRWLGRTAEQTHEIHTRKISDRKLRLFACACCFPLFTYLEDGRSMDALTYSYAFADNSGEEETLEVARFRAWEAVHALPTLPYEYGTFMIGRSWTPYIWLARAAAETAAEDAANAAVNSLHAVMQAAIEFGATSGNPKAFVSTCSAQALAELVREIAGNPFRPASFSSSWRTPTVTALASTIYEEKEWEQFQVLGDALREAHCTDPDIIGHCRSGPDHARGCWALDLILGKS